MVIDAGSFSWDKISMQYDSSNNIFQKEKYFFLRKLNSDENQIFALVQTHNVKRINISKLWNISVLSKLNFSQNMNIIENCEGYSLSNLIHDLKPIPRNISIELVNYNKVEPWMFDDINSDFWSTIAEFKSVAFLWKHETIKLKVVINYFDGDNLDKNNFIISIRGIDRILNYSQLNLMITK